uniref:ribosomal protein S4 n=1 Tax=Crepidomanes latealatum TaxID=164669 RepID=UPI0023D80510|nr:ribosomal protein S4 [Crepidomanes latealatum]WDE75860.1 ribosomal protein S4 [Crepidomanes latealatum]
MSRYRGPRFKILRRFMTDLPGFTSRKLTLKDATIVHDKQIAIEQSASYPKKVSQFRVRLEAKQRLRFNYGSTERQLLRYVRIARRAKGSTGQVLLQLLEMRLDNIVFNLRMAPTIRAARQLVNHRHILVNNRLVDIPSYRCKPKDLITLKNRSSPSYKPSQKEFLYSFDSEKKVPDHLALSFSESKGPKGLVNGIVNRESIDLNINELLVVEYYSRQV